MSDDGGPAFPIADPLRRIEVGPDERTRALGAGMSLRDYFAGQALVEMVKLRSYGISAHGISRDAYRYADAMIQARKEPES